MISIRVLIRSYMIQQLISNVCKKKFKILDAVVSEKSLTKNFIRGNKKWINKGNDKHEDADSVLHNTSSGTQCLNQISCSSLLPYAFVWEKSSEFQTTSPLEPLGQFCSNFIWNLLR